jgi:hypothetical protein
MPFGARMAAASPEARAVEAKEMTVENTLIVTVEKSRMEKPPIECLMKIPRH